MSRRNSQLQLSLFPKTNRKRTPAQSKARKAKADFIRWARRNPDRAWFQGKTICWAWSGHPSQVNGDATTYAFTRCLGGHAYQNLDEMGQTTGDEIPPFRQVQFWKSLPRRCAVLVDVAELQR